jgi:exosome complex component CSL4
MITRLSPQQATLSISSVDGVPLPQGEEFTGVVRTQDIRATEKDKVKIGECFRGGDVVKGMVVSYLSSFKIVSRTKATFFVHQISLGDARSYYVTTARNDLGVIFATSEAGECFLSPPGLSHFSTPGATMEPVSWQEMRCPKTGMIEKRKCAKPELL